MAMPDESHPAAPAISSMLQDLGNQVRSLRKVRGMTI